jgi:hypothetical protein
MKKEIIEFCKGKSEHGKSTIIIRCPFCNNEVVAYVWSYAGSGKKCNCGALLTKKHATLKRSTHDYQIQIQRM